MDLNYHSYYSLRNSASRTDLTYRGHETEMKSNSKKSGEAYTGSKSFLHFLICSISMSYGIKTLPRLAWGVP